MIKISELSKTFQAGKRKIHAVKSVSFDVDHGQVFGLLGPNGAGKTTTMRMILGLLGPDAGFAEIAGIRSDVYPDEIKRRVGFLSASAGVYQWLSGLEVLQFFGDVLWAVTWHGSTANRGTFRVATTKRLSRPAMLNAQHRSETEN